LKDSNPVEEEDFCRNGRWRNYGDQEEEEEKKKEERETSWKAESNVWTSCESTW